ncbi:hypothetical protein GLOIN_2v1767205 [Rhizophagus clarus]|uniref:Uncharacterized protein n=1 Tax=Rhizophagus clarus TaxID=94130 RepID=A0A8H3QGU3_9GLOM|nr:hypothetical protein GLOIN_2v1767205 [Rhizophagus clarus]
MIQLNNNSFIIRIVCNVHSSLQPCYICEERGQSSGINTSASAAITSVYQSIFGEGITFRPFIVELENITVFVSCLDKITISNTNKIGHNYAASLFHKYRRIHKVYDSDYVFQERELHAWRIMLYATGCTNITPYNKDVSYNEFWTNAPDPEKDCETIAKLYAEGLLSVTSPAEKFTYKEIIEQLEISPNSVSIVRKHSRINGPGCPALEKPIIVRSKICKNALWEKFSATYPNGMKCTSFMFRLQNSRYKYREDLGGLCITCNDYGYQPFRELFVNEDGMADHVDCINHCLLFAFRECMHQHFSRCQECDKIFSLFKDLTDRLDAIHHPKLLEYQEQLICYLAHQTRKAYLNVQFNSILRELDSYGAIIVVNYKCESYLQQLKKQKVNFLVSAVFTTMDPKPLWVKIISDNGEHYHNSELMTIISHWYDWYNIEVCGWVFLNQERQK